MRVIQYQCTEWLLLKNTGMPRDGGQNAFDTIHRKFRISIFRCIETFDIISNTTTYIARYIESPIFRYIETFDKISNTITYIVRFYRKFDMLIYRSLRYPTLIHILCDISKVRYFDISKHSRRYPTLIHTLHDISKLNFHILIYRNIR